MPKSQLRLSTVLLASAALVPAWSQSYDRLDRNRDGMISRDEWRGDMREFRDRDINRDGVLSGTELSGGNRSNPDRSANPDDDRDRNSDDPRDRAYRNRTREGGGDRAVQKLDKDNSGAVEGYEWPYNSSVFHRLDRDGNSVLTQDELRNLSSATMRDLDTNKNGRLDDNEWPGGFAQFERLDENNDGRVSTNEYYGRGGNWQRRQRFDSWDSNRDGVISAEEWQGSGALLRRLDENRDGRINWEEYSANTDRYDRPYGWRENNNNRDR